MIRHKEIECLLLVRFKWRSVFEEVSTSRKKPVDGVGGWVHTENSKWHILSCPQNLKCRCINLFWNLVAQRGGFSIQIANFCYLSRHGSFLGCKLSEYKSSVLFPKNSNPVIFLKHHCFSQKSFFFNLLFENETFHRKC